MTVTTTSNKVQYLGNGATTVFSFAFPAVSAADLQVTFTDANGVSTVISPTLYTVVLNPAIGGNPTADGGTVTYPLSGSPIALGTSLTIARVLPLTQNTSLANQTTLYYQTIEQALDYITMLVQQLDEEATRELEAPISDPSGLNLTIPPAAQRASKVLGFDGSGNVIALSSAPAGAISSAMQPVVNAASLAAGRTAFGLGGMATEGIGAALQDDGAGNVRVTFPTNPIAINQAIGAAFHGTFIVATGPITLTLPKASTLWNGFGFWLHAVGSAVTIAVDAADAFENMPSGTSGTIPVDTFTYITTNGALAGTWYSSRSFMNNKILGYSPAFNRVITSTTSGTYVAAANTAYVKVRMCGGGASGGAVNNGGQNSGGDTSFGSTTAKGAVGQNGGTGGTTGTGTLVVRSPGVRGGDTGQFQDAGGAVATTPGGYGAHGPIGGYGSGGQGATLSNQTSLQTSGLGGGSGEYVELILINPIGPISYSVGAGGAAPAGAQPGISGVIIIEEWTYQF